MADGLLVLLAVFATYRVARMLALEEGPFGLFDAARVRLDPEQKTWLGRGVNCPLCIGFYAAFVVAALLLPLTNWQAFVLAWLGIAGGMTVLYIWLENGRE